VRSGKRGGRRTEGGRRRAEGEVPGAERDGDAAVGREEARRARAAADEPRAVVQGAGVAIASPVAEAGFRCGGHGAGGRRPARAPRGKSFGGNPHIQRDDPSRCGHRGFSQARLADPRPGGRPWRGVVRDANAREEKGRGRRRGQGRAGVGEGITGGRSEERGAGRSEERGGRKAEGGGRRAGQRFRGDANGGRHGGRHAGEGFPGYTRRRRFSSEELARRVGRQAVAAFAAGAGYSRATVGSYRRRVGERGRKQRDWIRIGGTLEAGWTGGAGRARSD